MEDKMCKHNYWMLFGIVILLQETTRKFGFKIDKKYMDNKFEEEYHYF